MLPSNSIRVIRSRLHSQLKLQAMQPIPVCGISDQQDVVNTPAKSEFGSKCYYSDPAVLENG